MHGCSAPSLKHSTPHHAALRMLSPSASLDGRKGWSIPCCPEMGSVLLFSTRARARLDDRIYRVESSRSQHPQQPSLEHSCIHQRELAGDQCIPGVDGLLHGWVARILFHPHSHTISAPHHLCTTSLQRELVVDDGVTGVQSA